MAEGIGEPYVNMLGKEPLRFEITNSTTFEFVDYNLSYLTLQRKATACVSLTWKIF